jgi:hypothetical protein
MRAPCPRFASGTYLVGFGPVVGNTTSHWVNLDVPLFEAPEDVSLSPYSRDDVIQRLMGMLLVARRELDIRQKNEPASMPEQFAFAAVRIPACSRQNQKTLTPQFKFIRGLNQL